MPSERAPRKSSTRLSVVGFDLDGTLIDSTRAIEQTLKKTCAALSVAVDDVDIAGLTSLSLNDYCQVIDFGFPEAFQLFKRSFIGLFDSEFYRLVELKDGAVDTVREINALLGARSTFVLTNRRLESSLQLVRYLSLPFADDLVWSAAHHDGLVNRKATLLRDKVHSTYGEVGAAYVGDALTDVEAALHAGVKPFLLNGGPQSLGEQAAGVIVIKNLRDIVKFVSFTGNHEN